MNKTIETISEKAGISPEAVDVILKAFLEHLEKEVIRKKEFHLQDFGKFIIKRHKARKGRILKRGKIAIEPVEIIIPACNKIKFIPCERLKKKINS